MGYLPIVLFLLGVMFLFMGLRWQNTPNEEAMTALKGLAYLKREILQVQDQVHILEDKIQEQQIQRQESTLREEAHNAREDSARKLNATQYMAKESYTRDQEIENRKIDYREVERTEIERKEKSRLYTLKIKEQSEKISGGEGEPKRNISPKYQEVLELAAKGHIVPEIAQHLMLSQDAVMMVLQTQSRGAAR